MSDVVTVALIAASPGVLAVLVGLVNRDKIRAVHVDINSRIDALVKASSELARAEGFKAGRAARKESE